MNDERIIKPIAYIENDYVEKFGIPRQSGLVDAKARICFVKEYRNKEAFRGLEEYSYLWLIWDFSKAAHTTWHPTVRPPRLGGNERVGVFATRSPFRPNGIGLSSVRLEKIDWEGDGAPALIVSGADLLNGTPIYDIKPYLPHIDIHPEAKAGFAGAVKEYALEVSVPEEVTGGLADENKEKISVLYEILKQDPRPAYQDDPERIYGMSYANMEVKFKVVNKKTIILEITEKEKTR